MYVYYDRLMVNLGETDVSVILRSAVTKNLTVQEQAFCSVNREILRFAQNDVSPLKKGSGHPLVGQSDPKTRFLGGAIL